MALRLGATVCEKHKCRLCGRQVDELGHHGLSCVKSAGRLPRHAHLNDVVRRGLASAGIPAILEPVCLDRGDGKRPDGLTLFPYSGGRCLTWDATCTDTFAETVLIQTALEPGAAARAAEARKRRHYSGLSCRYLFAPIAIETSGVLGPSTAKFVRELGQLITASTGERRETEWLRQRLSVALVRGNAAAVLATATTARVKANDSQCSSSNRIRELTRPPTPPPSMAGRLAVAAKPTASQAPTKPTPRLMSAPGLDTSSLPVSAPQADRPCQSEPPASPSRPLTPASVAEATAVHQRRGLVNLGNTCFMNAVLQALYHSNQFRSEVLEARPTASQPHLAAIQRVFAFLAFSERPACNAGDFQRAVLPPRFQQGRQHDCSEFLQYLLDKIHEEECLSVHPTASSSLSATPPFSQPRTSPRIRDDVSVPEQLATEKLRPLDRLHSRNTSPAPEDAERLSPTSPSGSSVDAGTQAGEAEDPPTEPAAGIVHRLLTGSAETTYTCCTCGFVSRHESRVTKLYLTLAQPETEVAVSDLLKAYLGPERLSGDNQYHCNRCSGPQDADRQLHLLTPPTHLVVSLVRHGFDRRTGTRRKLLTPVTLTEQLTVPLPDRPSAEYFLYAVIVHVGHSLDAGHYFSCCCASGGDGSDSGDCDWWRLNDTTAERTTPDAALCRSRRSSETPYLLFYRLKEAGATGGRLPSLTALPGPLRADVDRDNVAHRQERRHRPAGAC